MLEVSFFVVINFLLFALEFERISLALQLLLLRDKKRRLQQKSSSEQSFAFLRGFVRRK